VAHTRTISASNKVKDTGNGRPFHNRTSSLSRRTRRIVVERDGKRAAGDHRAIGIRDRVVDRCKRIGRLVVRTACMQDIVEQRYLIRTRRLVSDLDREQVGVQTRCVGARRDLGGQNIADHRIGNRLKSDNRSGVRTKAEPVGACTVGTNRAAKRAFEDGFGHVRTCIACIGVQIARRARRIAACKAVVIDRSRSRTCRWRVRIGDVKLKATHNRVVVAIGHRERANDRGNRAQSNRVSLELVIAIRLHADLAIAKVNPLRPTTNAEHQSGRVDVAHTRTISASNKVKDTGNGRPFHNRTSSLSRRTRRIVEDSDIQSVDCAHAAVVIGNADVKGFAGQRVGCIGNTVAINRDKIRMVFKIVGERVGISVNSGHNRNDQRPVSAVNDAACGHVDPVAKRITQFQLL